MKKGLISITALAMVLGVGVAVGAHQASANEAKAEDTVTVYCKMTYGWWKADGAAISVHYWGGSSSTDWPGVRMNYVSSDTDVWKYEVPSNSTGLKFARVNGSGDIADWGAQTKNLTLQTDGKNLFTISNSEATWGDTPGCDGAWSTYVEDVPAEDGYYIVGTKSGWKYAGAPKMSTGEYGYKAQSFAYSGAAGEEFKVRSYFSGVDTWYGVGEYGNDNYQVGESAKSLDIYINGNDGLDVTNAKSAPSNENNSFYVYDRDLVFGNNFANVKLYGFGQAESVRSMYFPGSHAGLSKVTLGDTDDVYQVSLSTSYPKFIVSGNGSQTVDVTLGEHAGQVFVIGGVESEGIRNGYWLPVSEFTDIPAEEGYYIQGRDGWGYSSAIKMVDDDPLASENIAHYTSFSAKAGDEIRVSSFFSDRFPYNNWATLGGDSWDDWGEKHGDNFKFLKDGTNYNIYAKYESTEFKFYVDKIDAYEITMNAVLWNGATKDQTVAMASQTAYSNADFNPVTPAREGYALRGVYTDENCTTVYVPKKFTAAGELYVKYTKAGFYTLSQPNWSIDAGALMNTAGIDAGNNAETVLVISESDVTDKKEFNFVSYNAAGVMSWSEGLGATYSFATNGEESANNVMFTKAGTYAVYFSKDNNIYLNEGSVAFCTNFLSETGAQCDEYGKTTDKAALKIVWGEQKTVFNSLSEKAQKEITDVGFDGGKEDGTIQEQFMARYAYIIKKYGSAEFENFVFPSAAAIAPGSLLGQIDYGMNNTDSTALIAIVSVIAIASISAVAVLVVVKKRKHQ